MKFDYQARTREGRLKIGQVEASSYEAALDILQKYGYFVTFLKESEKKGLLYREIKLFKSITKKDIVTFTRQLAVLFTSEVPPVEALHTIAAQSENMDFKEKILKIASEVEGGKSLSMALSLYPRLFSSFYINMVKSGEASGELSKVLNTLADHLEREYDLLAKIRAATLYPSFIITTMIILLVVMLYSVFPRLKEVFEETERELPAITVFVLNIAEFLRSWGWFLLLLIIIGFVVLFWYIRTQEGRRFFDELIIRVPLIGGFFRKIYISRFSENLATLISGGLPIAQALEISGRVVNNTVYKKVIFAARDGVRRGETISSVFRRYQQVIPPLVSQMIFVGERTGQLDQLLKKLNEFYRKEVDLAVDKFISLLEPVLIVIIGLGVVVLILTILLPIYQIGF